MAAKVKRGSQRRGLEALAASLLLHALLALWLVLHHEERPAAPDSHAAIELQIVEQEVPAKSAPLPSSAPKETPKKKSASAPAASAAAPRPAAEPAKAGGAAQGKPSSPDAPKEISLVPSSDFVVASGNGVEPEAPRGHTVTNSPDERPDALAMRDYTQEKLGRRTGAMVEGMVADAQAKNGLVDPYFTGARRALEGALSQGNVPLPSGSVARETVRGLLQNQENYGRTGNPFAAGTEPKWNDFSLARSETAGQALQARDPNWAGVNRQAEQSMAAQAATMRAADRAIVEAVIELVQEPGGGIADAHVVKSSGYAAFDEYVLHRARKVFLDLEDPPDTGQGISSAGWRTLWRFSYWPASIAELRGQRVRVELLRVQKGQGSGNPLEHVAP